MKKCALLLCACFFAFFQQLKAQSVANYALYYSYETGYSTVAGATYGLSGGTANAGYFNGIDIPFDFWYMGVKYNSLSASTEGWFVLGSQTLTIANATNSLSAATPRPIIAPLWDDLSLGSATNFSTSVSGTQPNRVFKLQWSGLRWGPSNGSTFSFQASLYENGAIQFDYPFGYSPNNPSASIGFTGTGTGSGNFVSIGDFGVALLGTAAPIYSSITEYSVTTAPAQGLLNLIAGSNNRLLFVAGQANAPSNLTFSNVTQSTTTLNWTDNASNELGYVIYRSSDNVAFVYLGTTAANATSYAVSGLTANTTYYYKVYALKETLGTALAGSQATSPCPTLYPGSIMANYPYDGNANDVTAINNGTFQNSPTSVADRFNSAGKAYRFNGTSQYMSTAVSYSSPNLFTISCWFKTTTVDGGVLMSFGSNTTGTSPQHDRHLYMTPNGRLYFGVFPSSTVVTLSTTQSYNDGQWHQVAGVLSGAGMRFYVDGALIGTNTATTSAGYTGRWRVGFERMDDTWTGWPSNARTSAYFAGDMDDVLIYHRALTDAEIGQLYQTNTGASNSGPVCAGDPVNLYAFTVAGATYAWSGPNGFSSTLQNPVISQFALEKAGVYTVQVSSPGGCVASATTTVNKTDLNPGLWKGGFSTDWAIVNNWCPCQLPTQADHVTIPTAGPSYYPVLTSAGAANNLNLQAGASLKIYGNGDLSIAGAINNSGTINVVNGGITLNGSVAQTIPLNVFVSSTIKKLTLSNASGVSLGGSLRLRHLLNVTSGIFATNDLLTMASKADTTAQLGALLNGAQVTGKVTVERYLSGGTRSPYRSFRMLSSPVYNVPDAFVTSGERTYAVNQFIDDMIVTGAGGETSGFDASNNNNNTAYTYGSTGFVGVASINTAINIGRGLNIFYRGDRINNFSQKIQNNGAFPDPESIVMTYKGFLAQQDVVVPLAYDVVSSTKVGFNLVGNPYPSTIDWMSYNLLKTNVEDKTWIYDFSIGNYKVWSAGTGTNGASRYISSGQSFFVKATGAGGSLTFKEGAKATDQQFLLANLSMFSAPTTPFLNKKTMAARTAVAQQQPTIVRIKLAKPGSFYEDEVAVVLSEGATAAFDQLDSKANIDAKTQPPFLDVDDNTIDFDGVLNQGNVNVNLTYSASTNGYNLLGNPYASSINWDVLRANNSGAVQAGVRVYNPASRSYAFYDGNASHTLNGGSVNIAMGQGFFVQANAAGSFIFSEDVKSVAQSSGLLMSTPSNNLISVKKSATSGQSLSVNTVNTLAQATTIGLAVSKAQTTYRDETRIIFENGSLATYIPGEDVLTFSGDVGSGSVALNANAERKTLAINQLPQLDGAADIELYATGTNSGQYILTVAPQNIPIGYKINLIDKFTNTTTAINGSASYPFTIDRANTATYGSNRFVLAIAPEQTLPVNYVSFGATKTTQGVAVAWRTTAEENNSHFILERAGDDKVFVALETIKANEALKGSYGYLDQKPMMGNNYYRLTQVDLNGQANVYDRLAVVNFDGFANNGLSVFPSPAIAIATVKFASSQQDALILRWVNMNGQVVAEQRVSPASLADGHQQNLSNFAPGLYSVIISDTTTQKTLATTKVTKL